MSISNIVTRGYGVWGSIYRLATRGYSSQSQINTTRTYYVTRGSRRYRV